MMARNDAKGGQSLGFEAERLWSDVTVEAVRGAVAADLSGTEVVLAMAELISDDNGEIVFFNDSGFRSLALETDSSVVANGQAEAHVTASGADVTGFNYVTFDNGLTLYFQEGLDLVLHGPGTDLPA